MLLAIPTEASAHTYVCAFILVEQLVIDKCLTPGANLSGSAQVCQG